MCNHYLRRGQVQWEHPSPPTELGRRCPGSLPGVQGMHRLRIFHLAVEEQEPRGFMLLLPILHEIKLNSPKRTKDEGEEEVMKTEEKTLAITTSV